MTKVTQEDIDELFIRWEEAKKMRELEIIIQSHWFIEWTFRITAFIVRAKTWLLNNS